MPLGDIVQKKYFSAISNPSMDPSNNDLWVMVADSVKFLRYNEAMILTCDFYSAGFDLLDRMVPTTMSALHFFGFAPSASDNS